MGTLEPPAEILYGVPMMVGRTLMLRKVGSGELRDLVHIFRAQYLEHHLRITITDFGPSSTPPPVLGGTHS